MLFDNFSLSLEDTPDATPKEWPSFVTERDPNQLVQIQGDIKPCYFCARGTDCLLTYSPNEGTLMLSGREESVIKPWRFHCCADCALEFKLWLPPQQ